MTDKELLKLAAKAAGLVTKVEAGIVFARQKRVPKIDWQEWNPLTDDGGAFRLAVKLGFDVEVGSTARGFTAVRTNTDNWQEFRERHNTDPLDATRRAIVRAAAEIGRNMK